MKIKQGDSYALDFNLKQDGVPIKPNMVDDIEICIGTTVRKTYAGGLLNFDSKSMKWYLRLSQEETFAMEEGTHEVEGRVKYKGVPFSDVIGVKLGTINVIASTSREVL